MLKKHRKIHMKLFTLFALLFPLLAGAVMPAGSGPEEKYPRPEGLAGCGCFWEVRFDLNKKSARFVYDWQKRFDEAGMVRVLLANTGIDIVRAQRDLCQRNDSDALYRKYVAKSEKELLSLFEEIEKVKGVSVQCGETNKGDFEKDLHCTCPVPGVKLSN